MIKETRQSIEQIGYAVQLLGRSLAYLPTLPRQLGRTFDHAFHIGYMTMPIVGILSFFIGAVLALQTGFALGSLSGAERFLGNIVGLSMCRELGPLMASILLAGRVGSSITAELASMKVYNEVDALRTMNIPPERILVMPRLVAVFFMMPVLAILAIIVGWYGGMITAQSVGFISLDPNAYWSGLKEAVQFRDVVDGLVKAQIFSVVVVLIACAQGLATQGGPREVGVSVTRSVVSALVLILLLDFFVTKALM